ncbi:MAG: SIMPL domain-containing protein [Microcoleaceae cyanobacterium]
MSLSSLSWCTALVLSLSSAHLITAPRVLAQEQQSRIITATGQGVVSLPTTLTQVSLGVEIQSATAEQAQQESARRSAAVVELLRSRNVEDLATTGIQLRPIYTSRNGERQLTGYRATNLVSFQISTESAGSLIDDAIQAGATRVDRISFIADDASLSAAQQQALQLATQNAQQQAEVVLSALNLTQREIINIQVNQVGTPAPVDFDTARLAAEASPAPPTPVIGQEQQVRASVTLQIRY